MMTATIMETIYRKIEAEGVWLVDPKQVNYEQQQAILALRKAGRIEQAAYGGLKVKRDWRVKPAPDVRALLASVGVQVGDIKYIGDTKGAWARPGIGRQVTVIFHHSVQLAGADLSAFASEVITDDNKLVIRLRVA